MRYAEQLRLSRNLVQRAREMLEAIDLGTIEDPPTRARILGLSAQTELLEQRLQDTISLLGP
jgi:hypothetical protein